MRTHWVMEFCKLIKSQGNNCKIVNMSLGWIETINSEGKIYFTKSATYDLSRKQYFQGVDPSKLNESGDFVLICGGKRSMLTDIFIIPWATFFDILKQGKPINTYKPPKEYFQYKFYLRDRDGYWFISVEGEKKPHHNITNYHYNVDNASKLISSVQRNNK